MNYPAPVASSITAEVDDATMKLVVKLAGKRGITSAAFAADAIQRVVEKEADLDAFVQEGIDAIERGDVVPHDEVMEELDAMIEYHRARCST